MAFNETQLSMALFLTFCVATNTWFIWISAKRISNRHRASKGSNDSNKNHKLSLFEHALLLMGVMDWPWVVLCAFQCWINVVTDTNALHQSSGNDSVGCVLMGYYSTFSLISMIASNIAVAYYHPNTTNRRYLQSSGSSVVKLFLFAILPFALLFAAIPLMSTGYALTNGGFCYADWTDPLQAAFMLLATIVGLGLSIYSWVHVLKASGSQREKNHVTVALAMFVACWSLWVVASAYALVHQSTPPSPFMIIGGIMGHLQALLNPLLYGHLIYGDASSSLSLHSSKNDPLVEVHAL